MPAHNSELVLTSTLTALAARLRGSGAEVIVVENGSTDDTWALLQVSRERWSAEGVSLVVVASERGLGNALRAGTAASTGDFVLWTADDLPFGFSDLDAWLRLDAAPLVAVGSKGHPASSVNRALQRRVLTRLFTLARRLVLDMRTRDPQGTVFLGGDWARCLASGLRETGYLITTEAVLAGELAGLHPVEIPVTLSASAGDHPTRVRVTDIADMAAGLFRLRRRRADLRAAGSRCAGVRPRRMPQRRSDQ